MGDEDCDKSVILTDRASFLDALGRTPEEIAATVNAEYSTELRWETIVPPLDGMPTTSAVRVATSYVGSARLFPMCGNLVELDMRMEVASDSGLIDFSGPAILTHRPSNHFRLTSRVALVDLSSWNDAFEAARLSDPSEFVLDLDVSQASELNGGFFIQGESGGMCELASFPGERPCEIGERRVSPDVAERSMRPEFVVEAVRASEKSYSVKWGDSGSATEMMVDFLPVAGAAACVAPRDRGAIQYSVLGDVRITTADGRLNATIPGRATTLGNEGRWTNVGLEAQSSASLVAQVSAAPGISAESDRVKSVLQFSPPTEVVPGVLAGGVSVRTVEVASDRIFPSDLRCLGGGFVGRVSEVTSLEYTAK